MGEVITKVTWKDWVVDTISLLIILTAKVVDYMLFILSMAVKLLPIGFVIAVVYMLFITVQYRGH